MKIQVFKGMTPRQVEREVEAIEAARTGIKEQIDTARESRLSAIEAITSELVDLQTLKERV